jgi:predicted Zn-dependent protease
LQVAYVDRKLGEYKAASSAIRVATRRSPRDYTLWEEAAQIDANLGDVKAVRRDLAEVKRLNPNASIFQTGS